LRENTARWIEILRNPETAKEQFDKNEKHEFGITEYNQFVRAVGEYLGSQFEPIPFDYKQHKVKFFDIERNLFITKEDRKIHIANLSQGQSKITSLTGSFKKMDPNKKKIVLIDEISELDPQNLENVKKTLKSKLEQGSLLLAVLVRPSSEAILIKKWD
jgi:Cu/Ag efflux protein CusF